MRDRRSTLSHKALAAAIGGIVVLGAWWMVSLTSSVVSLRAIALPTASDGAVRDTSLPEAAMENPVIGPLPQPELRPGNSGETSAAASGTTTTAASNRVPSGADVAALLNDVMAEEFEPGADAELRQALLEADSADTGA